jgi:hypothetical protein
LNELCRRYIFLCFVVTYVLTTRSCVALPSASSVTHSRSDLGRDDVLFRVRHDNDSVLAQLLLHQDDLFLTPDHKVPSRIHRTLSHPCELGLVLPSQVAQVAPQHDRQGSDMDTLGSFWRSLERVGNVDIDTTCIRRIGKSTLHGRYRFVAVRVVTSSRRSDPDVGIFDEEFRVSVGDDQTIGLEDLFDIRLNKVVERVEMLLDETLNLEESRQELPFVLANQLWPFPRPTSTDLTPLAYQSAPLTS